MSTIYHRHHIIPKHAGGTNDPSNITKVTVADHAKAHFWLYLEYGRWQDFCAYLALSNSISYQEATRLSQSLANKGKKHGAQMRKKLSLRTQGNKYHLGFKASPDQCKRMSVAHIGKVTTEETKAKLRKLMLGKKDPKYGNPGSSNPFYGRTHPDAVKLKISEFHSKTYLVIDPQGQELTIKNLKKFCREQNLTASNMCAVSKGKATHHKGWKCIIVL